MKRLRSSLVGRRAAGLLAIPVQLRRIPAVLMSLQETKRVYSQPIGPNHSQDVYQLYWWVFKIRNASIANPPARTKVKTYTNTDESSRDEMHLQPSHPPDSQEVYQLYWWESSRDKTHLQTTTRLQTTHPPELQSRRNQADSVTLIHKKRSGWEPSCRG